MSKSLGSLILLAALIEGIAWGVWTPSACPESMALVPGSISVCIDRHEASLVLAGSRSGGFVDWSPHVRPGELPVIAQSRHDRLPQAYISGAQARQACRRAGKRLCTSTEWLAACRGLEGRRFPYGNQYRPGVCNEGRTPHPVLQFFGEPETTRWIWSLEAMNHPGINQQPNTVALPGAYDSCQTPEGVYDLVGNLHEWVEIDPRQPSRGVFRGGFYVDARINGEGCSYRTTAHPMTYHDYSTGFRCCRDLL